MFGPLTLALLGVAIGDDPARELAPPVRLEAGGKPIDTAIGHAAPFVGDFYGPGSRDLLVGKFGEGILWVSKNIGTKTDPSNSRKSW